MPRVRDCGVCVGGGGRLLPLNVCLCLRERGRERVGVWVCVQCSHMVDDEGALSVRPGVVASAIRCRFPSPPLPHTLTPPSFPPRASCSLS
jgi:hypothetical protein